MSSYYLIALLIVIAIPVVATGLVAGAFVWARDAMTRGRAPGAIGVLCTFVATANLFVPRRCAGSFNRPVITAFLGDDACQRSSLVAIQLVLLLAVATALVARADEIRR